VLLDEVEPGVYEGSYTIRQRDRIVANSTATVNLRLGNRAATSMLDESLGCRADHAPSFESESRISELT
jgi:hypothetical protein